MGPCRYDLEPDERRESQTPRPAPGSPAGSRASRDTRRLGPADALTAAGVPPPRRGAACRAHAARSSSPAPCANARSSASSSASSTAGQQPGGTTGRSSPMTMVGVQRGLRACDEGLYRQRPSPLHRTQCRMSPRRTGAGAHRRTAHYQWALWMPARKARPNPASKLLYLALRRASKRNFGRTPPPACP
jgi:hypothetical protein